MKKYKTLHFMFTLGTYEPCAVYFFWCFFLLIHKKSSFSSHLDNLLVVSEIFLLHRTISKEIMEVQCHSAYELLFQAVIFNTKIFYLLFQILWWCWGHWQNWTTCSRPCSQSFQIGINRMGRQCSALFRFTCQLCSLHRLGIFSALVLRVVYFNDH